MCTRRDYMSQDEAQTTEATETKDVAAATSMIDQLRTSKKLHDEFAQQFRHQYMIAGRLIKDWKQHFRVNMPPDINTQICQVIDSQLMELHQEATFLKAEAEARLTAQRSANQDKYRTKFAELVTEYKSSGQRLPAKDTLAALAEVDIGETKNATVHTEIELSFWKEILSDLTNCRRLVENATINLSVEAKALANEKYLEKLNSGGYHG